ncbi:unnamed protein product [Xylocopa violacea]|uniref:Uncharacterized protein n=1 Tax=Xylocopa violacea TaxID=135666 RepID=A0ABP1P847_XYLVO
MAFVADTRRKLQHPPKGGSDGSQPLEEEGRDVRHDRLWVRRHTIKTRPNQKDTAATVGGCNGTPSRLTPNQTDTKSVSGRVVASSGCKVHLVLMGIQRHSASITRIQRFGLQLEIVKKLPQSSSLEPIAADIYRGSKNSYGPITFFKKLISDIQEIMSDGGIDYQGTKLLISLRCYIADAPAEPLL